MKCARQKQATPIEKILKVSNTSHNSENFLNKIKQRMSTLERKSAFSSVSRKLSIYGNFHGGVREKMLIPVINGKLYKCNLKYFLALEKHRQKCVKRGFLV